MSKIVYHETFQADAQDTCGHYWAIVEKDGEFHKHVEYKGYSGYAVADEVFYLRNWYPASEGYVIRF